MTSSGWRRFVWAVAAFVGLVLIASLNISPSPAFAMDRAGAWTPAGTATTALTGASHERGSPDAFGAGQGLGGRRHTGAARSAVPSTTGVAAEAGAGAENAANGLRLGQQLARESADSAFTSSGGLQQEVIDGSTRIIPGSNINNPGVIKQLTSDGSDIADWGKYTSRTFQSPSGPFQVHYYYNPSTGVVDYGYDYKVVFNGAR